MNDNERVLNADVRARLDEHLASVDRALSDAGVSSSDRRDVCDEVETHAREMVWQRAEGEPTEEDMTTVLAELDDPEDYRQALSRVVMRVRPDPGSTRLPCWVFWRRPRKSSS